MILPGLDRSTLIRAAVTTAPLNKQKFNVIVECDDPWQLQELVIMLGLCGFEGIDVTPLELPFHSLKKGKA